MPYLFCNISWMSEYQGHRRINQPEDQPQRGGRWVLEHGTAHECCNFLSDEDGNVYGHVETWRGDEDGYDTQIRIENLGADTEDSYVEVVDVIWIATHESGGRRVVGWYKNARIYRNRQFHEHFPTHQHQRDNVDSYRITANIDDVYLITESDRKLKLGTGRGWPGHSPIFYPADHADNKSMAPFLERLNKFIGQAIKQKASAPIELTFNPESCGESTVYVSDVRQMRRIHGKVVNALYSELREKYGNGVILNNQYIDLAVADSSLEKLFEVKTANDKQSIYTGIGQLLFHSGAEPKVKKVLVLPRCTNGYDEFYQLFDAMGVWISEYFIDEDDEISFAHLPD